MYGHMNFESYIFLFVCLDKSLEGLTKQLDKLVFIFIFNKSSKHPIPSHF